MELPKNTIRNPLTIIAIFAGIAEVSGSIVLVNIPNDIQKIFVWFVIFFPVMLVGLFFLTLLLKHHVLYAPSDYRDEKTFSRFVIKPQTREERINLKEEERMTLLEDLKLDVNIQEEEPYEEFSNAPPIHKTYLAEEYAFRKIQSDLRISIQRDVKIEIDGKTKYFDGIAEKSDTVEIFELKFVTAKKSIEPLFKNIQKQYSEITQDIKKTKFGNKMLLFNLILVVTTESKNFIIEANNKAKSILQSNKPFINLRIFDFDSLLREFSNE